MKINFKSKILVKGLLVLLTFSLFSSTAFAEKTYLHIVLRDTKHPATVEEVERILDRCPEWLDSTDEFDFTPLHYACRGGKEDVAKLLIDKGADLNAHVSVSGKDIAKDGKDILYWCPLIFAARNGYAGIVRYLLARGARASCCDSLGLTPLHYAVRYGHLDVVRELFENKATMVDVTGTFLNDNRVTPLCLAARYASLPVVDFLVNYGAKVNYQDTDGWTPLMYAVLSGDLPKVQFLLAHGANPNNVCINNMYDQCSPLHCAAYAGRLDIAKYLVEKGADVNLANKIGQTPLHVAVKTTHADVAKFLVFKGSYVYRKDNNGKTPFMLAEESGNYAFAQELLNCH